MANIIDWLKDKAGNIIAPKTLIKAVQNEDGETLETTIENIQGDINTLNSNLESQLAQTITVNQIKNCVVGTTLEVDVSELGEAKAYVISGMHGSINTGGYSIIVPAIAGTGYQFPIYNGGSLQYLQGVQFRDKKLIFDTSYTANTSLYMRIYTITAIY